MKISVILIDGGFREKIYSAASFSEQEFNTDEYEIIWVEFHTRPHPDLFRFPNIKVVSLGKTGDYHASYCFNRGISDALGKVLVIADADQIVERDFLTKVWESHLHYDKLAVYGYRYDQVDKNILHTTDIEELKSHCALKNPYNYGGCLTIRKKWLMIINGYDQNPVFGSHFHANGLEIYTRLRNLGVAIQWCPDLRLYHPYHPFSLIRSETYRAQKEIIRWRAMHGKLQPFDGLDPSENDLDESGLKLVEKVLRRARSIERKSSVRRVIKMAVLPMRRFIRWLSGRVD